MQPESRGKKKAAVKKRQECSCKADAKGVRQFNAEVIEMHHTEEEGRWRKAGMKGIRERGM